MISVHPPYLETWDTGKSGPEMPLDAMMTLVTALLGLGAMRTFEKMNGRSK